MLRHLKYITESIESQRSIEKLTDKLLSDAAKDISRRIEKQEHPADNPYAFVEIPDDFMKDDPHINKMRKPFQTVKFTKRPSGTRKTQGGYYNADTKEIVLHYSDYLLSTLKDWAFSVREFGEKGPSHMKVHSKLMEMRDTLVHELTHVYDDVISKGKVFTGYPTDHKEIDMNPEAVLKAQVKYWRNNAELNAFYSQAVAEIRRFRRKSTWQEYRDRFMASFGKPKFANLKKKQQQRILSRLYAEYVSPETETEKKLREMGI